MKLFLDACAIIYWVEMAEPHYSQFADQLNEIRKTHKKISFVASYLSLLECRVKPMREQDEVVLKRYQDFFCAEDLLLVPMDFPIIEKATELRAFHQLKTPDAFQAATALSLLNEADVLFVTGDVSFKKIPHLNALLIN